MHDIKHGAIWFGHDETSGAELVFERLDSAAGVITAVFLKRELYYVRVFYRTKADDPTGTYIEYAYWAGSWPSWFETFDEAVAEASRLLETGGV